MRLKKCVSLVLVSVLSIMLVGCSTTKSDNSTETTKKEKKKLTVGMEVAYPPFEYYEADGITITGFDYGLALALGEELGYEMEFKDVAFDSVTNPFFSKPDEYDIVISGITITDERKKEWDFSDAYIENYQCVVTLSNATTKPASLEELNGLTVGYQGDSTSYYYLKDNIDSGKIKITSQETSKIIDSFSALKDGKVNAVVCDSVVAEQYCKDSTYEMTFKDEASLEEFGIVFPKGSELVAEFNKALATLKSNGKLEEINKTYFK